MVRKSLALLLQSVDKRTETYASAEEFLSHYDENQPGCLVLDMRMPYIDGLELQEILRKREVCLPVIMMTGNADVPVAVSAMKAGAIDFIEKPFDNQKLLALIDECVKRGVGMTKNKLRLAQLTPRERQVFDLLIEGHLNKTIASQLGISTRTVEIHRARIMDKLEAKSISDLIRLIQESKSVATS